MSERRNAVPLNTIEACLGVIEARGVTIATLTRERDEARAEVERLRLYAKEFTVFGPSCPGCMHSPAMAHEPDCDVLPYVKNGEERGAASERAAIVAMLEEDLGALSGDDASDACKAFAATLRGVANRITRLDHHRDGGGE